MWVDLRKIIDLPGAEIPFEFEIESSNLDFPSVSSYDAPPFAEGRIYNEAGVLHLEGSVDADMVCICDRCGAEFESTKVTDVDVVLVESETGDEGDPDVFVIEGGGVNLDEVLATCFILDMETKFLCSEDCKGICERCGKNLNLGPCGCRKPVDPRFAVLEQLLDNK